MTDTAEQAKAKYPYNHWWDKIDENCIIHQLGEDILLIPFEDFHKGVEELLGRPVHTHELVCPSLLISEYKLKLLNDVKEKVRHQLSLTIVEDASSYISMPRLKHDIDNYLDKCLKEGTIFHQNKASCDIKHILMHDTCYKDLGRYIYTEAEHETKKVYVSVTELLYNTAINSVCVVYNTLEYLELIHGTEREVLDKILEKRITTYEQHHINMFVAAYKEGMKRWHKNTSNT